MIKLQLNKEEKKESVKPFPKLMIRQDNEDYTLILALSCKGNNLTGIVISSNYSVREVGEYFQDFGLGLFTDYNEPITIQHA